MLCGVRVDVKIKILMDFRKWWMNVPAIMQLLFMTTYLVTENTLGKPTQGCFQAVPGKLDLLTHLSCNPGLVSTNTCCSLPCPQRVKYKGVQSASYHGVYPGYFLT